MFKATEDRRVIVDSSKSVVKLGVQVPGSGRSGAKEHLPDNSAELSGLGATETVIRTGAGKDGPVITELGNVIVDCRFDGIAGDLEKSIKEITGVVESGLFQGYLPTLIES